MSVKQTVLFVGFLLSAAMSNAATNDTVHIDLSGSSVDMVGAMNSAAGSMMPYVAGMTALVVAVEVLKKFVRNYNRSREAEAIAERVGIDLDELHEVMEVGGSDDESDESEHGDGSPSKYLESDDLDGLMTCSYCACLLDQDDLHQDPHGEYTCVDCARERF